MPLADFCKGPVITLTPEDKVFQAAQLMRDRKVGSIVVTKEDKPIGILTDRDILLRVMVEKKDPSATLIRDVMTPNPFTVPESVGVWELIQAMKKHSVRRFPVISASDGKLVGMITMDDLIELMGDEMSGLGRAIAVELGHPVPAGA